MTLFRCAMSLLAIYFRLIWHRKKLPGKGNVSCLLLTVPPPPSPPRGFLVPAKDGGERMDNWIWFTFFQPPGFLFLSEDVEPNNLEDKSFLSLGGGFILVYKSIYCCRYTIACWHNFMGLFGSRVAVSKNTRYFEKRMIFYF
jgi:hypothetical protein